MTTKIAAMLVAVMLCACGAEAPEPTCSGNDIFCENENAESLTWEVSVARCQAGEPIWEPSCSSEPRDVRRDVTCYDRAAMRNRTSPVCVGDSAGRDVACVDICPNILGSL